MFSQNKLYQEDIPTLYSECIYNLSVSDNKYVWGVTDNLTLITRSSKA